MDFRFGFENSFSIVVIFFFYYFLPRFVLWREKMSGIMIGHGFGSFEILSLKFEDDEWVNWDFCFEIFEFHK